MKRANENREALEKSVNELKKGTRQIAIACKKETEALRKSTIEQTTRLTNKETAVKKSAIEQTTRLRNVQTAVKVLTESLTSRLYSAEAMRINKKKKHSGIATRSKRYCASCTISWSIRNNRKKAISSTR